MNWFINKLREIQQKEQEVPAVVVSQGEHSKPKVKKPRKPRAKKEAAPKVEPKVDILKFDFDPNNPRLGSIELDWNSEFVELLTKHGYTGETEEDIVDKWLNDVCRNIAMNDFQGANVKAPSLGAGMVSRKPIGDGKTEIS